MPMRVEWDGGNQLYWDGHRERILDVIGPGVEAKVNLAFDIQTTDPAGWISTVVEAGVGTTELSGSPTAGIIARITNAANEDDGGNYQAPGQTFRCVSGQKWYAGLSFTPSDADQSDLLFGVCITDTTLLGGMSDGAYMECLDGGANVSVVVEKDASETQTDSMGTLVDATTQIWEMFWDGEELNFYIDGVLVKTVSSGEIPDNEPLRLSLAWLNGDANVRTLDIQWCRGFAWAA